MSKRRILFVFKLAVSVAIMALIVRMVVQKNEAHDLWARLSHISWPWVLLAACAQWSAIACSLVRWQRLLRGQGILAPWRHLFGSFMIGRFFGAFTPGGWTGLNGYRIYDIAKFTGKTARATATIGIEMLLGQLAFGAVVIAGSIVGARYIGEAGVILVDGFFLGLIALVIWVLSRPNIFRSLASRLPRAFQSRTQTTVDAVCAYQGQAGLLSQAALLGMGTHTFNSLVFVAAARALGANLGPLDVFFVSAMQIFATLIPASINGIGLREATAVALYTRVGVPVSLAALIPMVGFAIEMAVSSIGGLILALRPVGYTPNIEVENPERENFVHATIEHASKELWPKLIEGLRLGGSGGMLAGVKLGTLEAMLVLASSKSARDLGTLAYGATSYALLFGILGAIVGLVLSWIGRRMQREALSPALALAHYTAAFLSIFALAIGAFRIRRDVFSEQLVWKSSKGLLVLLLCVLCAALLYALSVYMMRSFISSRFGAWLLKPWGAPLWATCAITLLLVGAFVAPTLNVTAHSSPVANAGTHQPAGGPVLLVVVDTLRADHLPSYGYTKGNTPHLDAFARDAVRFDQAFANSSWTRPSFATILSGRFAASHGTMAKMDALPSDLVTVAEAYQGAGYQTAGFVTNYNVAPYFNFHQGFDEYEYLEPSFVLGANDTAAKLLLIQFLRQRIETWRAKRGDVEPGSAYQDAETVNKHVISWLEQHPKGSKGATEKPWFLFVGYMDPHDPYFPHPYNGQGYARAAHQSPDPSEAPKLEALYNGEITYWDAHFGRLIAKLKALGVYDHMTIVVTADHGEEFGEHGGFWHGTTLYDEQLHVPLFVKLPHGTQGGTTAQSWVQLVDIAPTLLRLSNIDAPKGMQGNDLFGGTDELFAEENHEGNVLTAVRSQIGHGASQDTIKLIRANPGNPRKLKDTELYRISSDKREQHDISESEALLRDAQSMRLAEYQDRAHKGASASKKVNIANDTTTVERLKALGYGN